MSTGEHIPVSAYIITFNNEATIERALESLHWVDEIVVVDSFSTDGTLEIVRRYTDRIEQREWPGFRDQYQHASEQCTHDWALFLDADEEVSSKLAEEMQEEMRRNAGRPDAERVRGYYGPRRTYYLGRWHLHGAWIPDREIRLYERSRARWEGGLHASIRIEGREEHFKNFYYHYTYENLSDQIRTIDRYSETAARDMVEEGRRPSLIRLVGNPLACFLKGYIFKGGFREGMPGFIVAISTSFYVFVKYAKLWEAQGKFSRFDDGDRLP
ncbi:MAG: glycosyltransferase family 2 protein [Lentisphaeria bacterium]|nr:glycosyltransferase family 2 protein [Lentisphaeria bacterium]